jgi:hypothetical protein
MRARRPPALGALGAAALALVLACGGSSGPPAPASGTAAVHTGIFGLDASDRPAQALTDASGAGFDLTVVAADRAPLDALQALGMKGIAALWLRREVLADDATWRAYLDDVRARVAALRGHPALYAWYVSDEPDGQGIPPATLDALCAAVRAVDGSTPLLAVFDQPGAWRGYLASVDIVAVDPYLRRTPGGDFEPVTVVTDWLTKVRADLAALGIERRVTAVLPAFDLRPTQADATPRYRKPTPDEFRTMTQLALAQGVDTVLVYAYAFGPGPGTLGWELPLDDPALWEAVRSVPQEVR